MKQKIKYLFIAFVFATYFACESDSNCGDNFADFARFNVVYVNEDGVEVDSISQYNFFQSPQTFDPDTVYRVGIGRKAFDFSPAHDTLKYVIYGVNKDTTLVTNSDTIQFAYRKINRVDSPDCPIDYSFTDLDLVYHTFDSAAVVNTNLTLSNNAPNIKFYIF